MTRHLTRTRALLIAFALVVAGVSTTGWIRAGANDDYCTRFSAGAEQRAGVVTGSGRSVLVIGDSYSVGAGVGPRVSWPVRLPGRVRVNGFSGSGFSVGASACGDVSYAARLQRDGQQLPGLVVVEGGLNDVDQPDADIEAGFARLMRDLRGTDVLVVGPPLAPRRDAARIGEVDALLARLSQAHGASYLSMTGVELTYLDDRLHPDPAGHQVFGDVVAAEVRRHHTALPAP